MSDQGPEQQVPGGSPQPPSPPVPPQYPPTPPAGPPAYTPPAYMPPQQPVQPAYGQPPTQPPAKKGKGGLIAVIIAVVVICGLVSCGAIALTLYKGGSGVSTSGGNSVAAAEAHVSAAMTAVQSATTSLKAIELGDSSVSEVNKVVGDISASLSTARDEIVSAKALAEAWKDSPGKADYIASLTEIASTLDSMQELVAYLKTASTMLSKVKAGGKESSAGLDALNDAISAGNVSKYSSMRSKARSASSHYAKAVTLFREAHGLDESAGLDKAAKLAGVRKKQADVAIDLAADGSAHRLSAYNSGIKKLNGYARDAAKIGTPAIVSNPRAWAERRLGDLGKRITDGSTKADQLRKKALIELGYTK